MLYQLSEGISKGVNTERQGGNLHAKIRRKIQEKLLLLKAQPLLCMAHE